MRAIASFIGFGAAIAMGWVSTSAAGASFGFQSGAVTNALVVQIDYRRCWTSDGKRHCRWVRDKDNSSGSGRDDNAIPAYGAGRPENYRVGTGEWYRAMERDGRLGTEGSPN